MKLFFLLAFLYITNINSQPLIKPFPEKTYPFNSTKCYDCIMNINYIHKMNLTLTEWLNNYEGLCIDLNISCEKFTNKEYKFLMSNSSKVCESMGYCDELTMNNFVIQYESLYIYYYYNNIIGYNVNSSNNGGMTFTKKWQFKIDEPYNNVSIVSVHTPNLFNNGSFLTSCFTCSIWKGYPEQYESLSLLKLSTQNYIYYINISNGIILNKINILNNYIPKTPLPIKYNYNTTSNPKNEVINIYDPIYNGSMYIINFNINSSFSYCNPSKYTTTKCIYNNIISIKIEPQDLIIPSIPLLCYQYLQKWCPKNTSREKCLNCLVKNKNYLQQCSVLEEENWCID